MKLETMEDLFLKELKDLYDAEQQLVKALPKMAKAAASEQLRNAFQEHLTQTETHVSRLEDVFSKVGQKPATGSCAAMKGLIKEGDEIASAIGQSPLRDAGLIAAANRVEHYEIAAYGSVRTFARILGHDQSAALLERTLDDEKAADQKLTQIAESMINQEAAKTGWARS